MTDFRTMKFRVLCFVVAAVWSAVGHLPPFGEHVCMVEERYFELVTVKKVVPITVPKVEWCWSLPPRCTVKRTYLHERLEHENQPRVRKVPKCCTGYQQAAMMRKCVPVCSEPCLNGDCTAPETCSCDSGYRGVRCEKPCKEGTWGRGCLEECDCHNNATCEGVLGKCICPPGWIGVRCDSACTPGFYGLNCSYTCDCGGLPCNHETGICATTTEVTPTTTEVTVYETTTETQDLTNSTETESSTVTDVNLFENSTVEDLSNSTDNLLRVYSGEINKDPTDKVNETVEDNEIEHSQDLMGVQIKQFNIFNILENLSIICGIFLLIFVVTMSSVMVSHYRKIRKTVYKLNTKNNSSNPQNFPLHRFYGGSVLPSKTILDQVCTTNIDMRVEQPKFMTFKPLPDEKSKVEYIMKSTEPNTGSFDNGREPALGRHIVQFTCGEPKSISYISTRCKSV